MNRRKLALGVSLLVLLSVPAMAGPPSPQNDDPATADGAKAKHEEKVSDLTPEQVYEMLGELSQILDKALSAEAPQMFQWVADVRRSNTEYYFDVASRSVRRTSWSQVGSGSIAYGGGITGGGSETGMRGGRQSETRQTMEREKHLDQVFVDEWSLYIGYIQQVQEDMRYKALVNRRWKSDSIWEFAIRAPDEHKALKKAVREALTSVDELFEQAKRSKNSVANVPRQAIELQERIGSARREVEKARAKLANARTPNQESSAQAKLTAAIDALHKRENELVTDIAKLELNARSTMEKYALASARATNKLLQTMQLIRGEREQPQEEPVAADESVPLDQSVEKARAELESYRKKVAGLTALGQETELDRLQEAFRLIFTEKPAYIEAFIESTERVGADHYETVLLDRQPGAEAFRCRITLTFDDEFKEAMAALPAGSKIILVAKIEDVRPEPDWDEIGSSKDGLQLHLSGAIARLEERG